MPGDVDENLLHRLRALRASSSTPDRPAQTQATIGVDVIERARTPTREDALAARLKSLRNQDGPSSPATSQSITAENPPPPYSSTSVDSWKKSPRRDIEKTDYEPAEGDDVDAMFQTDDTTLEELLANVDDQEEYTAQEPGDDQVKALLEQLSKSIPQGVSGSEKNAKDQRAQDDDSDDSDGEQMSRSVNDIIARFRDELEVEAALAKDRPESPQSTTKGADTPLESTEEGDPTAGVDVALPSVPSNLNDIPLTHPQRATSTNIDDIAARMAALRAPADSQDDSASTTAFPSVPASKPSGKPIKRLTSKTNYTDEDMEGWCTVCLEDATLRCVGCDDDVYCSRCWREMHIGPSAGFDERSHKAVQFTKERKKKEKKVALGAS